MANGVDVLQRYRFSETGFLIFTKPSRIQAFLLLITSLSILIHDEKPGYGHERLA
jgi:hypothetical protein